MGAGGADEDDGLARFQATDAMQDIDPEQRPALLRLFDDARQGLFGHAGKVFEEQPADVAPVVEIPHVPHETHHGTDTGVGGMQGIEFLAGIEGRGLHTNGHG